MLRQLRGAAGNGLVQDQVNATHKERRLGQRLGATAWAPLSSTSDAQRAAPRATAWVNV